MKHNDFYNIRGIPRDGSGDDIQRAFRKLARSYHPDVCKKPDAEERFKEMKRNCLRNCPGYPVITLEDRPDLIRAWTVRRKYQNWIHAVFCKINSKLVSFNYSIIVTTL